MSVKLGTKWAAMSHENDKLKSSYSTISSKLQQAQSSIESTTAKVSEQDSELASCKAQLAEKSMLLEAAYAENRKVRKELMTSQEKCVEFEDAIELKTQELLDTRDRLDTQKRANEKLSGQLVRVDSERRDLESKLQSKQSEIDMILKDLEIVRKTSQGKDNQLLLVSEKLAMTQQRFVTLKAELDLDRASRASKSIGNPRLGMSKLCTPIGTPREPLKALMASSAQKTTDNPWD